MLNKMLDQFNGLYGLEVKDINHKPYLMHGLIADEVEELDEAIAFSHKNDCVVKEAIDIIYITCQQLRERGVDVDTALEEVHRSNMSKMVNYSYLEDEVITAKSRYPNADWHYAGSNDSEDFYVIKCADTGKVIKPTTYSPAIITDAMINNK